MKSLVLFAIAPLLFAQPHLQNAHLETRAVSGSLDSTFRALVNAQPQPAWIAYAAPLIAGNRNLCCSEGCALESRSKTVTANASGDASGTVHLEGAPEFNLFFRIENRQVEKIRSLSMDCNVDAGGLTVYWLTGARPAQSVALLESLLPLSDARPGRRLSNSIISAIAFHRDAAADSALDRLTVASQPEETRRQAAFWLGNARGRHGYESLLGILRNDQSERPRSGTRDLRVDAE